MYRWYLFVAIVPRMRVVYAAFGLSGAAALLYEITWTRLLTLFMGQTVAAASTVLAAFMGGLAAGAATGGRVAIRLSPPAALRAYAGLELLIAMLAVALPFELRWFEPLLSRAYANGDGGAAFAIVRIGSALAVVTLPAIAMGATLPLVVRGSVDVAARAGRETGRLYAVNTLGAATGAIAAGFVLLPALGMSGTTFVAMALNALSAVGAWVAGSRLTNQAARLPRPQDQAALRKSQAARVKHQPAPWAPRAASVAVVAIAISGAVALVQQIAWTRILALVVGPTTYAFSAMVGTFLVGIAVGSAIGSWAARRGPSGWRLAIALLMSAAGALVALVWAPRAVIAMAVAVAEPGADFASVVRLQVVVIAGLVLPMTIAFGAAFPLAVALAARTNQSVPADVSVVYTANTIGAIAGALAGGFWLVPAIGLEGTVRAAAGLAIAGFVAVTLVHASTLVQKGIVIVVTIAASVAIWLLPHWDRALVSSGAYKYAAQLPVEYREALLGAGTLLYYREGAASTVSVRRTAGVTMLAIDGKVDASNGGDMLTQRLLAHVPLLLHEAPRRVGIIGLGSGVTLASALTHPVERVDVIEISPDVVDASAWFVRENRNALRDPRARLVAGDGRTHLALGRDAYDVLISEPSNPWMAGIAALFTREFFEAARDRLAPGGLLCQWAHTYDIREADLRSIVATLGAVFSDVILLLVGEGDVLLVGSREPLLPRLESLRTSWSRAGVAADLAEVGVTTPDTLLSMVAATKPHLDRYSSHAVVQRDDRMSLEFTGPRGLYGAASRDTAGALRSELSAAPLPPVVTKTRENPELTHLRGSMLLRSEAASEAFDEFVRAVAHNPRHREAADALVRAAAQSGRIDEAGRVLDRVLQADPQSLEAALAVSRLRASLGDFAGAAAVLDGEMRRPLPDPRAIEQLASVAADAEDATKLAALVGALEKVSPQADATRYYAAQAHAIAGRLDDALRVATTLDHGPDRHARCQNLLGTLYASAGRSDEARRAFAAAIEADPRDPAGYMNLGTFEMRAANPAAAARLFAEALTLDPSSQAARRALGDALRK
jgi:spermidine synthase